ncbi:hypothetical protein [Rhodococcoides corynebacterioides]|uniref:Mce-associated membrane protein n=1 Tax=Rhodococcoides corynebacterioides TaxID=53972 RepID=A0ABS7P9J2_9NOCA|nr:hypothetical protein [Rhodococcus corynebacterioides]MBY6367836.1 hypothetical protein [Rhodococcus corynebacterioides]MBY6408317.1 hypothetical protein [Rhodococcus corynebacterioides]
MPPARRRPPVGATRPPAGAVRRKKVAGRPAGPVNPADTTENSDATESLETTDETGTTTDATPGAVDLSKPATETRADTDTDTDTDASASSEPSERRPLSPLVSILGALAVVFAVIAVLGLIRPGAPAVTNSAWVDTGATLEVTSAGRDALQTVFSYGFDTIDQDQEAARAVLNDERRAEYDSTAEQTKQGVLQTQTVTTATVTDIGVSLLDGDRAELVASMDIAAQQDTVDQGTVQTPVAFTMERVDGRWLLATIDNR